MIEKIKHMPSGRYLYTPNGYDKFVKVIDDKTVECEKGRYSIDEIYPDSSKDWRNWTALVQPGDYVSTFSGAWIFLITNGYPIACSHGAIVSSKSFQWGYNKFASPTEIQTFKKAFIQAHKDLVVIKGFYTYICKNVEIINDKIECEAQRLDESEFRHTSNLITLTAIKDVCLIEDIADELDARQLYWNGNKLVSTKSNNYSMKELKTGMIVEYNTLERRMVVIIDGNTNLVGRDAFATNAYDMFDTTKPVFITKVYESRGTGSFTAMLEYPGKLIWESVVELSMQEIADKFGININQIRIKE